MEFVGEDVIVTSAFGDRENCLVIDPQTGSIITTFKGGNSAANCLTVVGKDYVVSALCDKPILHVWNWPQNDRIEFKIVLPGIATALDVSSSGIYCIVGISNKIYIWNISNGNLLKVLDYHNSDIQCLKLSKDDRFIVSSGVTDASLSVWDFHGIFESNQMSRPFYKFHDHTSAISDVYVSTIGCRTKVVTCGLDCSCFVYDLSDRKRIFSKFHDEILTSVAMDRSELFLFLGTSAGNILVINLQDAMESRANSFETPTCAKENIRTWKREHRDAISSLSLSSDSRYLISGSKDFTTRLWDLRSNINIKTFKHEGEVTNAFFTVAPYSLVVSNKESPSLAFAPLKKAISTTDSSSLTIKLSSDVPKIVLEDPSNELINRVCFRDVYVETKRQSVIEQELHESQTVKEQLYSFVMGTFLNIIKDNVVNESPEQ